MATENTTVTPCPGCGQKVRFPTDRGFIKFKCPACKAGLEWGTPPAEAEIMDVVIGGEEPTHKTLATDSPAPPRLASLLYLTGSFASAYATYWLDKNANENMLMILGFMGALALSYYLFFRAIRVATRFGPGGSVALLVLLSVTLPYACPTSRSWISAVLKARSSRNNWRKATSRGHPGKQHRPRWTT